MLAFREGMEMMEHYGLPPLVGSFARTREEAIAHARKIGQPVALKLISRVMTHKAAAGLVKLNLFGDEQIETATEELLERGGGDGFEGLLVQPMISGGVELFLGALVDPQFGPLVAFGAGGSFVELLGGSDFLRPPFSVRQARAFLERNPVHPLLARIGSSPSHGDPTVGGGPSASSCLDALVRALMNMARLITERAHAVRSVDINPLVVSSGLTGPITLDFRFDEGGPRNEDEH